MALSISNVLGTGDLPASAANPLASVLPSTAGLLRDHGLLAAMVDGREYGDCLPWSQARRTDSWLKSDLNSASATFLPIVMSATELKSFLRISAGASTDHHGGSIQESYDGGTTVRGFNAIASGVSHVMRCRIRSNVVTTSGLAIGLAPISTTPLSAASAINLTSLVGFYKAPASAALTPTVRTGSSSTSNATTLTLVADTWHTLEMAIIDRTQVSFSLDGTIVNETTVTNLPAATVALAWTFAYANGASPGATGRLDIAEFYAGCADTAS